MLFIVNHCPAADKTLFIGNTYIYVGDDPTAFSSNLQLGIKVPINEGGFIKLDKVLTGRYVVLRRIGGSLPGTTRNRYAFNEIKVYGSTNLIEYGATISI